MQSSKLPFREWYIAFHLITATKKSISSKELQRQLGKSCYLTVWEMVNIIHDVMGKDDYSTLLSGEIELDDVFFSTDRVEEKKLEDPRRGSQDKTTVLVMTESETVNDSNKRIKKKLGHVKLVSSLTLKPAPSQKKSRRLSVRTPLLSLTSSVPTTSSGTY